MGRRERSIGTLTAIDGDVFEESNLTRLLRVDLLEHDYTLLERDHPRGE